LRSKLLLTNRFEVPSPKLGEFWPVLVMIVVGLVAKSLGAPSLNFKVYSSFVNFGF